MAIIQKENTESIMKKIIYILLISTFAIGCNSTNSENKTIEASAIETDNPDIKEPKFEFKETVWDFGTIEEGESVEHTFKFKNVGKGDLVISNCSASCGCTIPQWPKEPLAPGEEGSIKVVFNSAGKSGVQTKDVTILANTIPVKTVLQINVMINKKPQS